MNNTTNFISKRVIFAMLLFFCSIVLSSCKMEDKKIRENLFPGTWSIVGVKIDDEYSLFTKEEIQEWEEMNVQMSYVFSLDGQLIETIQLEETVYTNIYEYIYEDGVVSYTNKNGIRIELLVDNSYLILNEPSIFEEKTMYFLLSNKEIIDSSFLVGQWEITAIAVNMPETTIAQNSTLTGYRDIIKLTFLDSTNVDIHLYDMHEIHQYTYTHDAVILHMPDQELALKIRENALIMEIDSTNYVVIEKMPESQNTTEGIESNLPSTLSSPTNTSTPNQSSAPNVQEKTLQDKLVGDWKCIGMWVADASKFYYFTPEDENEPAIQALKSTTLTLASNGQAGLTFQTANGLYQTTSGTFTVSGATTATAIIDGVTYTFSLDDNALVFNTSSGTLVLSK